MVVHNHLLQEIQCPLLTSMVPGTIVDTWCTRMHTGKTLMHKMYLKTFFKKQPRASRWWHTDLSSQHSGSRGRRISVSFEASLVYRVYRASSRMVKAVTQRNPVLKYQKRRKKRKNKSARHRGSIN